MRNYHIFLISAVFLCYFTCLTYGNIHRAIPPRTKGAIIQDTEDSTPQTFYDRFYSKTREAWLYSIIASLVVGSTGIFPLLIFPSEAGKSMKEGVSPAHLKLLLSFAVGGLLGDVFLHLLPEAWMYVKHDADGGHTGHMYIGLWVIAGLLSFLIFEKVFGDEDERDNNANESKMNEVECEKKDFSESVNFSTKKIENGNSIHLRNGVNKKENGQTNGHVKNNGVIKTNGHCPSNGYSNIKSIEKVNNTNDEKKCNSKDENKEHIQAIGYLNLLANCIDNFTHGLAVAGSFVVGTKVGMCTTFAILLHEIPHEVGDFAILLKSGFRRRDAAIGQIVTASGALFGAVFGLLAEGAGDSSAWVLPFTSGGFIYIAMVTVVPDLLKEADPWESLKQLSALGLGIVAMGIVSTIHH